LKRLLVLVLVAGCLPQLSGPSPTDPADIETTTTLTGVTATTITAAEGAERFRECLGDHGISVEPIPMDGVGRPRLDLVLRGVDFTVPDVAETLDTCAVHLITGALDLTDSPLISSGVLARLTEFGDCVRARGVPDFPAMVGGFYGIGPPFPIEDIPYDDPDLPAAVEGCRQALASR
jgi:hypothetical protein